VQVKNHIISKAYIYIILGLFSLSFSSCGYKRLVNHEEKVSVTWSALENYCQERVDLARQLTATYEDNRQSDKALLNSISAKIQKFMQLSIAMDPGNLSQKYLTDYESLQFKLDSDLNTFVKVSLQERPTENEIGLLKQKLYNIDQKIGQAALQYNEAALEYNSSRQRIWHIVMASIAGFKSKGYYYTSKTK
jgi:hypothetical protein